MFEFRLFSGETRTRHLNALTAICGLILALALAAPVSAQSAIAFDIPAQNLSTALSEYARQSGLEMLYSPEIVADRTSTAVDGDMTRPDALRQLLQGTGLEFEQTPSGGMMVGDEAALAAYRAELAANNASAGQNTIGQRRPGIEEIIVTGQKREERIQDVPIAISAFSPEDLEAQKIEGGFDLLKGVPNVTFSKTNFTGYNFQIRGIGTQAISATTDPGVAVSLNNTTLIVNRLFEQEYLDVERVEVLRGPQGTLFGRNATGGVINVITKKPELGVWDGMIDVEVGNYNTRRLRGMFNMPIGDTLAIRGAYASTKRDGFATNSFDGSSIDGRDLWTGRLTIGWQPNDRFRANLMWERFEEDDDRLRSAKQLCHRDEGPDEIGTFVVDDDPGGPFPLDNPRGIRKRVQQGCVPGSLFSDGAFDTPEGDALPFVTGLRLSSFAALLAGNLLPGFDSRGVIKAQADVFAVDRQSRDLREIYSPIQPEYRAEADIFEFSFDFELSDALQLSSQTVYVDDELFSTQDFTRFRPAQDIFTAISAEDTPSVDPMFADLTPGGVFCDPQLGCDTGLRAQDIAQGTSSQFNQEFRLVSSFPGDWNFSLGANYTDFETRQDYFVFSNLLTALAQTPPFDGPDEDFCTYHPQELGCVHIQEDSLHEVAANPQGHNFFLSSNPYELTSWGLFGELYWHATDTVKVTAGLRYTWDRKVFSPIPSQTLLPDYREHPIPAFMVVEEGDGPEACTVLTVLCGILGNAPGGIGYPANPDIVQTWREPTGRLVVDWQPQLGFTDETMVYASFSHGYKGGGANPPTIAPPAGLFIEAAQGAAAPRTFEPEYVNAYELGTKNTLFGGALVLNGTAFYYDYTDYQVSKIVDRSAANENFDAEIWGAELEAIFAPSLNWQFNAVIGWLQTEIARGERSIDLMDRAQEGEGGRFFVTGQQNPGFDPSAAPVPEDDFVAVADFVGGVPHWENEEGDLEPVPAGQEFLAYDEWVVLKPNATQSSNCVAPAELLATALENRSNPANIVPTYFCPAGNLTGVSYRAGGGLGGVPGSGGLFFDPTTDAPNGGAGFFADVGGNELPQAPEFTVALGGQYNFDLTRDWRATARVDYYWQDESFHRVYNTEYDRLKSWSNTNLSFWVTNPNNGITVEAYVKNVFDETPITGAFLNSDDTGLSTNVFTLDPRLIGVSIRKEF